MENFQRSQLEFFQLRRIVLLSLLALPVIACVVVGSVAVWKAGWLTWLAWMIPAFWTMSWLVAKLWKVPDSSDLTILKPLHWTPRDAEALEIVRRFQLQVDHLSPEQLTQPQFYLSQAQSLAMQIAKHYHPQAAEPADMLTVPEVIAATRLVVDDLEQIFLASVPFSRMVTIGQWKKLADAPKWIQTATQAYWATSILVNPLNVLRYGVARVTNDRVSAGLQTEFLANLYLRFIRQTGFYLIEMNSGRLRGGADFYRAAFESESQSRKGPDSSSEKSPNLPAIPTRPIHVALLGQTSAGKSSLINALLGATSARIDALPCTNQIQRYELRLNPSHGNQANRSQREYPTDAQPVMRDEPSLVTLLDTPGYGQAGASQRQLSEIQTALEIADLILLVIDAHSPARDADRRTLEQLMSYYSSKLHLQPPPVIAVLTHVDLLSPVMHWSPHNGPSLDWQSGKSAKEQSIAGAVQYAREIFGGTIVDVVPICTDSSAERRWGIAENLLPSLVSHLDQAQAVSLLSTFESILNRGRIVNALHQTLNASKWLLQSWLDRNHNDNP